jgi:hypothetical protein
MKKLFRPNCNLRLTQFTPVFLATRYTSSAILRTRRRDAETTVKGVTGAGVVRAGLSSRPMLGAMRAIFRDPLPDPMVP